jgi:flagellar biogenesis protein FliO
MEWGKLVLVVIAGLLLWQMIRTVRANPQMVSKQNLTKSFTTMGVLALLLIGFVAFCVVLLRQ